MIKSAHSSFGQLQLDDTMLQTPQYKRFKRESLLSISESPFLSGEVILPSDIDKLKNLFPLLDYKVRPHVWAYISIVTGGGFQWVWEEFIEGSREAHLEDGRAATKGRPIWQQRCWDGITEQALDNSKNRTRSICSNQPSANELINLLRVEQRHQV